jgi:hypothetical protein
MVGMIMHMARYLRTSSSCMVDDVAVTFVLLVVGARTVVLTTLLYLE